MHRLPPPSEPGPAIAANRRPAARRMLLLLGALWGIATSAASPEELGARLAAIVQEPQFGTTLFGVRVESARDGRVWFDTHSGRLFRPASNAKLFTAALALDRIGGTTRLQTRCYSAAPPDRSGTLRGDLLLVGAGDFSFAARFHDGDRGQALQPLVRALQQAGIRRIRGDLIGDATRFRGPGIGTGWTWGDLQEYYGTPVAALFVDDGVAAVSVGPRQRVGDPCRVAPPELMEALGLVNRTVTGPAGSPTRLQVVRRPGRESLLLQGQMPSDGTNRVEEVPTPRPVDWFLARLRQELKTAGIRVDGDLRGVEWPEDLGPRTRARLAHPVATVESPPLRDLLRRMMKDSQNQYAQLLLLQVGSRASGDGGGPPSGDTEAAGLRELQRFLEEAGVPKEEVFLQDGAGLSRGSLVTPRAVAALLRHMLRHRESTNFVNALPVAGVDGTLRNRLRGTLAEGRLQAKTGTLTSVSALSGYVPDAEGPAYVFSLLVQHPPSIPTATIRQTLDRLALVLMDLAPAAAKSP